MVHNVCDAFNISKTKACNILGFSVRRITYKNSIKDDETELTKKIVELATKYGRYGYRRIHAMLKTLGFHVNHKRVERIWREQGLKVPRKQPKKKRLWLTDGSIVRLQAEHQNHVWSYDFVTDRLETKKSVRWLNIIDEYTRICIYSEPRISWTHKNLIEVLSDCFILHGIPLHMRSDNGPEFIAKELQKWFQDVGVITSYIEPGSPWENGYCESFNSKMRDEFLNLELFSNIRVAKILTNEWVRYYNTIRPHSSLGYQPPKPASRIVLNLKFT